MARPGKRESRDEHTQPSLLNPLADNSKPLASAYMECPKSQEAESYRQDVKVPNHVAKRVGFGIEPRS